ncbi:MAG: hypothetical protein AAF842_11865 [Planctomycetota bacterium]
MTHAARTQKDAQRQAREFGEPASFTRQDRRDQPLPVYLIIDRPAPDPSAGDRRATANQRYTAFLPVLDLTDGLGPPRRGDFFTLRPRHAPDTQPDDVLPITAKPVVDTDGYTLQLAAPPEA